MRIVVTGAGGFVGQALLPRLAAAGHAVRPAGRRETGGIGPETDWTGLLEGADAVIHLAARVHQMDAAVPEPQEDYDWVNAEGTRHLAETAARAGVRRLVALSTAKVMGEASPSGRPFRETDPPAPQDPYARSKHRAERHLAEVAARTGLETVILRPPLVYGPGVKGNFRTLLRLADSGLPLPLGAVGNRRSLVSVGTLADAIATAVTHPAAAGVTGFVSDGEDISTAALLRRLRAALGRPARLLPVPPALLRAGAVLLGRGAQARRLLDSFALEPRALAAATGWAPPETLDQGLEATVRWWRGR